MKLTCSRSTTSGAPLAATSKRRSRIGVTVEMSISPATVRIAQPCSCRTSMVSASPMASLHPASPVVLPGAGAAGINPCSLPATAQNPSRHVAAETSSRCLGRPRPAGDRAKPFLWLAEQAVRLVLAVTGVRRLNLLPARGLVAPDHFILPLGHTCRDGLADLDRARSVILSGSGNHALAGRARS